jgi:hypothetical protein
MIALKALDSHCQRRFKMAGMGAWRSVFSRVGHSAPEGQDSTYEQEPDKKETDGSGKTLKRMNILIGKNIACNCSRHRNTRVDNNQPSEVLLEKVMQSGKNSIEPILLAILRRSVGNCPQPAISQDDKNYENPPIVAVDRAEIYFHGLLSSPPLCFSMIRLENSTQETGSRRFGPGGTISYAAVNNCRICSV